MPPESRKHTRRVWPIAGGALMAFACLAACAVLAALGMSRAWAFVAARPTALPRAAPTSPPALAPSATPLASATQPVAKAPPAFTPAPSISPAPPVSAKDTQLQLSVFQQLWDAVNTSYVYTDFNGLDWNKLKPETEAKIKAGVTFTSFYDDMRGLVESLNDNHSAFLSPEEAKAEDEEYQGDGEYVGVGIRWDVSEKGGYVFVLQTMADSPAEKGGVKAHDHILKINGEPVMDGDELSMDKARGLPGTPVTLTVQSPGGQPRDVVLIRGDVSSAARVEYRVVSNGGRKYGYILIPTLFEQSIGQKTREALRALNKTATLDGFIVDMRINGGGAYPILTEILGFFTNGEVGRLVDRTARPQSVRIRAERVGQSQTLPLVVLMGPSTESYAEVFAGALQYKSRAALIGSESAGNIETLRLHEFKDGSAAWLAEEAFRLPNGLGWEGKGLTPDVRASKNWDEFTEDSDPGLAAAVAYLKDKK